MQYRIFFLCLFTTFSIGASALPTDAEQDLFLESEELEYDEAAGTITYSGSVIMQQGSMKITADKVIIHGDIEQANKVNALGKPAHFQQTPVLDAEPVTAEANELEYKVADKSLLLQGNAFLNQEGSSLSGNRIEYDVKKSIVKASSLQNTDGSKERVRMVIPPKVLAPNAKN